MISNSILARNIKIGNKYLMNPNSKLGHGSFGQIYLGIYLRFNIILIGINIITKYKVAIKAESGILCHHQLRNEAEMLDYLQGGEGIPHCYYYQNGKANENNLLVMDLLGPSLECVKSTYMNIYTLQTVLLLADQMVI